MKFRFYITNTYEGNIEGTDSAEVAESFAESEDFFVVDAEAGKWLKPESIRDDVNNIVKEEGVHIS